MPPRTVDQRVAPRRNSPAATSRRAPLAAFRGARPARARPLIRNLTLDNSTCAIVVDRHVPKNAGTSVRSMLQRNARAGACTFVGYDVSSTWRRAGGNGGFNHVAFGELLRRLRPGTRWCVEAHIVSDSFWADVARLHAMPRTRALVMVRVREPYAWYTSYYEWQVLGKQRGRVSRERRRSNKRRPAQRESPAVD